MISLLSQFCGVPQGVHHQTATCLRKIGDLLHVVALTALWCVSAVQLLLHSQTTRAAWLQAASTLSSPLGRVGGFDNDSISSFPNSVGT
jgi:hypothetical protein